MTFLSQHTTYTGPGIYKTSKYSCWLLHPIIVCDLVTDIKMFDISAFVWLGSTSLVWSPSCKTLLYIQLPTFGSWKGQVTAISSVCLQQVAGETGACEFSSTRQPSINLVEFTVSTQVPGSYLMGLFDCEKNNSER